MNKPAYTQRYLRKRKMLLVLPLLVLPFITMAFWALGGGKASGGDSSNANYKQGLNLQLPDAKLKEDKGLNKLSYYEMAAADSAKLKEKRRSDPYFAQNNITVADDSAQAGDGASTSGRPENEYQPVQKIALNKSLYSKRATSDPNEEKILRKLHQLNAALDNTVTDPQNDAVAKQQAVNRATGDRPEAMMQNIGPDQDAADPEMNQINGMLDKIMNIQHPELLTDKLQQYSSRHTGQVFALVGNYEPAAISLLGDAQGGNAVDTPKAGGEQKMTAQFYSLGEDKVDSSIVPNSIAAIIAETQIVSNGATIKCRLVQDAYINGTLIGKNSLIYGSASLTGERLTIAVKTIAHNGQIFPLALSVFDLDGMEGIYIPGAITRTTAKESTDKAIQSVALSSIDPSVGAQAASAGIEAAKSMLSRNVKLVKVTLKAGYRILLRDNNNK